ncbi:MAG: hypothetical protein ABI574_05835 [Burkholderiales bacterium]
MATQFDAQTIARELRSPRWTALARTGLDLAEVARFDTALLRDSRVLVPMDVQGLYVPPGSTEAMVRLPLSLAGAEDADPPPATGYLEDGPPRPAGVHLHWAMPDALLRGKLADNGPNNRLSLPALPDRWVVLRIAVPKGASAPSVRGWVIEADLARVVPLDQWPAGAPAIEPSARAVPKDGLTGSAGGSLNWTGVYDATLNRFALHDPLDDLATIAPAGLEGEQVAYTVCGWWSDAGLDPLDGAQTDSSLHERLRQLGWVLVEDREDNDKVVFDRAAAQGKQASLGLDAATRYTQATQAVKGQRALTIEQPSKGGITQIAKPGLSAATAVFADKAARVVHSEPTWPRSTLLHGSLYGVPVGNRVPIDNRPAASALELVWGEQGNDLAATLASTALAPTDAAERRVYERLLAGFTGHLMDRVDSADGLVDVEEWEHAAAFTSRPGGASGTDRLLEGADGAPLIAGRQARGIAARAAALSKGLNKGASPLKTKVSFGKTHKEASFKSRDDQRDEMQSWGRTEQEIKTARGAPERSGQPAPTAREVVRPAPRFYTPDEPMIAVRGARRSLRHGGDGRVSQDSSLRCRYPSQVIREIQQVVSGKELLPSLGTAAVPDEVTLLAREALLHNPYIAAWVAATASSQHGLDAGATHKRVIAEAALRYGSTQATYDGTSGAFSRQVKMSGGRTRTLMDDRIADQLRRFSLAAGVDPDPVGITAWSQPWVPLWLEWELALQVNDALDGWPLGPVDLDPAEGATAPAATRVLQGRSLLTTGTAVTLSAAVRAWLQAEDERDKENKGEASESAEAALARIAAAVEQLDVLSARCDGVREQLLGLRYDGGVAKLRNTDGSLSEPLPSGEPPLWLRGGIARLQRARLVDAFGRTLALPLDKLRAPQRLATPLAPPAAGAADAIQLAPRFNLPARLMLRLVDPANRTTEAAEATVDQVDPARMVNPVAGFLLPDHIDESLEVFDITGQPLGQLTHEPIGGGVVWEMAPGRDGPVDAGPLFGLAGAGEHLGWLAAGTVTADAQARAGDVVPSESALSALLRAIDTTMWSVDALRGLGTEHIAGLVGRPIAVVRVRLSLELLGEHGLDPALAAAALADRAFTVRVGEITRADDALLGYFVNDDYQHVHVVDKVVAQLALDSGRLRGQLAGLDHAVDVPATRPIDHPYVVAEDELKLHLGQSLMLTLLMHPAGKAHATCGVLPRKSIQLARDWVAPGLAVIAPSARVGPVLIDPAMVRLPKISSFPKDQLFTRRDSPGTWKDDPILAATQEALLPDMPHEVQEGYIRIAPDSGGAE